MISRRDESAIARSVDADDPPAATLSANAQALADEDDWRPNHRDQICEELNIKKVTLHNPAKGPLLKILIKPNMKSLGPKFGQRLQEIVTALASADGAALMKGMAAGKAVELHCPNGSVTVEPTDLVVHLQAPEGWTGVEDRETQVLLDVRITDPLKREGMARDVVRQVQELRKKAKLEMENRIVLHLQTDSEELRRAIDEHRAYIESETLAAKWSKESLQGEGVHRERPYSSTRRMSGHSSI